MSTNPTLADARRTARQAFGWDSLLPGQAEAIVSVVGGRDTLVVFPTGAGKSAVYQIAGLELGGVTLVISPLLALQRDQVASIDAAPDAPAAVALNSKTSARSERAAWAAIEGDDPVYVFLAPEQLARDDVLARLGSADVRLLVVDEAHCVSAWGHDFRPDYARIGDAVAALGRPPVLALTATASTPVRSDIVDRLGMRDPHLEVRGMDRPEIHLAVRRHESGAEKRRAVIDDVAAADGASLLYVATRRETGEYAAELAERGRRTAAYHGGMSAKDRDAVHAAWSAGHLDVVVATSAFGMGIDKPDVRLVVHADVTESLDAYAQEIGRAARDGRPARAVLHYRPEDFSVRSFFAGGRAAPSAVSAVWAALSQADGPVRAKAVGEAAGVSARTAARVLGVLVTIGAATSTTKGFAGVGDRARDEVVEAVRDEEEAQRRIRESRIAVMRGYAEAVRCRRIALLDYFGVDAAEACGACDRCDAASRGDVDPAAVARGTGGDDRLGPDDAVEHAEWGAGTVVSVEDDRMTVFFESQGYKVVAREALERGILDVA
ncbi:RecQ family ATP-dependent DNA helicase [Microbacterium sp. 179-I 3D2 NHS]|uniref:RecQ family ATP-dependent DNA helicase n=1 Tax=Microbacterium sp. 179-I 3D2 NHS TaxID=3235178 RepID=UPI0039A1EE0C